MNAGDQGEIIGRNPDSGWWQVTLGDGTEGWVNASLISGSGPLEAVAIAQSIPTLALTPVPVPAAAATPIPQAGPAFRIVKARMLTKDENGGCMGNHNIFVKVINAQGNPLDGVAVQRVWGKQEDGTPLEGISGSKGSDYLGGRRMAGSGLTCTSTATKW